VFADAFKRTRRHLSVQRGVIGPPLRGMTFQAFVGNLEVVVAVYVNWSRMRMLPPMLLSGVPKPPKMTQQEPLKGNERWPTQVR
jgi:hypothetical protein